MLASPISASRRQTRSFCLSPTETHLNSCPAIQYLAADELVTYAKRLTAKLLSANREYLSSRRSQYFNHTGQVQRRCQSEVLLCHTDPAVISQTLRKRNTSGTHNEAARQIETWESRPRPATNDVVDVVKSSCIRATHLCNSLSLSAAAKPPVTNSVQPSVGQVKHPAEAEWERLWYSGVSLAFSKIAHHFPELTCSISDTATGSNIAEPTLALSGLKAEDRAIFKREDQKSASSFVPQSGTERLRRLQRSQQAIDETQRQALLLGLPTFREYLERKSQSAAQARIDSSHPSKRSIKRQARLTQKKEIKRLNKAAIADICQTVTIDSVQSQSPPSESLVFSDCSAFSRGVMTHERKSSKESTPSVPAQHRPLVVGLTKPQSARSSTTMASSSDAAALNKAIEENLKTNTKEAAPAEETPEQSSQKPKKEKAPKQPKPPKAAAPVAPTSPALIDLRVGHILRAIAHPNADSLYVSTIAMGDAEGTEHTQVDEETGKVVRTVCSGLKAYIPLEEMQDRKIVVVANLKPVNMRSIKSAAMVLAASPKQEEGADPHAPDRVVELVIPPAGAEAGDKVYFEGWPYGAGLGPEKVLNPKKKQWEAIQPGFYTSDDLVVGFDAGVCDEVEGSEKGNLVVDGKGTCTVKTLKGAVVR